MRVDCIWKEVSLSLCSCFPYRVYERGLVCIFFFFFFFCYCYKDLVGTHWNYRDGNHSDFCGIIPIFKSDFRITIPDIKIPANNDFKTVPDEIKEFGKKLQV